MSRYSRTRSLTLLAVALGLSASGCAESTKFRPAVFSASVGATNPATIYGLQTEAFKVGRVTVWSPGIVNEHGTLLVDVRLIAQNQTSQPMRFDPFQSTLEFSAEEGRNLGATRAVRIEGSTTVPPKSVVEIRSLHPLPAGVHTNDISVFALDWKMHTDAGNFGESTAFVQWQAECCEGARALYPVPLLSTTETDDIDSPAPTLSTPPP